MITKLGHQSARTLASSRRSRNRRFCLLCRRCRANFPPDQLSEEPVLWETQMQWRHRRQTRWCCDRRSKPFSTPTSAHRLSSCPSGPKVFLRQSFSNTPFRLAHAHLVPLLPAKFLFLFLLHATRDLAKLSQAELSGLMTGAVSFSVTGRLTHAATIRHWLVRCGQAYQLARIAVYGNDVLDPRVNVGLAQKFHSTATHHSSLKTFSNRFLVCRPLVLVVLVPESLVVLFSFPEAKTLQKQWEIQKFVEQFSKSTNFSFQPGIFLCCNQFWNINDEWCKIFVPRCNWEDCALHWTRKPATGCGCHRCLMSSCSCAFVNIAVFCWLVMWGDWSVKLVLLS